MTKTLTLSTTNVATWTATADSAQLGLAISSDPESMAATTAATVIISAASDDQDQDTIPDNVEGAQDVDGDNLPNFLDEDADGDSQLDRSEAGNDPLHPVDSNNNGVVDYLERVDGSLTSQRVYMPVINKPR